MTADRLSGAEAGNLSALLSMITVELGRLRVLVEPREVGRCCHDNVPVREIVLEDTGDGVDVEGAGTALERIGNRSKPERAFALLFTPADPTLGEGLARGTAADIGVKCERVGVFAIERSELGVPTFDVDSFVGDIDRACSRYGTSPLATLSLEQMTGRATCSPSLSFLPAL